MLVKSAYGAYCLNLPVTATDYLEEQEEIMKNYKEKLILENGLVTLPDPLTLQDGWYSAPENLPNTVYDDVIYCLDKNDAGKACKSGKSLLDSEHLSNVMTYNIRNNIIYTFVRGCCFQGNEPAINHMMFGSAYSRILKFGIFNFPTIKYFVKCFLFLKSEM